MCIKSQFTINSVFSDSQSECETTVNESDLFLRGQHMVLGVYMFNRKKFPKAQISQVKKTITYGHHSKPSKNYGKRCYHYLHLANKMHWHQYAQLHKHNKALY